MSAIDRRLGRRRHPSGARRGVARRRDHEPRARHAPAAAPRRPVGDLRAPHRARAARRRAAARELPAAPRAQPVDLPRVDRAVRGARVPDRRAPNRSCSCTTTSRRAEYFEPYDPVFADLLDARPARGRAAAAARRVRDRRLALQRARARGRWATATCASCRRSSTCAASRRSSRARRRCTISQRSRRRSCLSVGQLMPHKRPDFLVQMMHIAETYLGMRGLPDARRPPTARAVHARDPRAGPGAESRRRARGGRGRRGRPRGDVPLRRRGRDRERARRLLPPAARGDDVREADRRPRAAPRSPRRSATRALLLPAAPGPGVLRGSGHRAARRTHRCATSWSRAGPARWRELERRPPDVAVVEALLEVV